MKNLHLIIVNKRIYNYTLFESCGVFTDFGNVETFWIKIDGNKFEFTNKAHARLVLMKTFFRSLDFGTESCLHVDLDKFD